LEGQADEILRTHGNLFRFGAQGPDFLYHNSGPCPRGCATASPSTVTDSARSSRPWCANPSGSALYLAHPFLERIVDIHIPKERFGLAPAQKGYLR
jgi:hypothetical protein